MSPPRPDPVLDAYVAELVKRFRPLDDAERAACAVLLRPASTSTEVRKAA